MTVPYHLLMLLNLLLCRLAFAVAGEADSFNQVMQVGHLLFLQSFVCWELCNSGYHKGCSFDC